MMPVSPHTHFDHYEIIAPLGKGGMGEVYQARDTRLDRPVAIKILPAEFAQDVDRLRRFELEAKATSALNHANILTVYDFGTFEGNPYLVMELLDGEELRAQLEAGTLPVRKAIDYAQQIAAGLAAAHEKNIVHRDLKPENLFITNGGRVKILDFGLAKLTQTRNAERGTMNEEEETLLQDAPNIPRSSFRDHPLTIPGTVMGTVAYMSPEQVRGQDLDHRSDIFSFGIILYEMLTGNRAFTGESQVEVMNAILKDDPPELSAASNRIPPQLDKIMRRCLEKKPEMRFHSAHDLGFALSTLTTTSGSQVETATALPALTESVPVNKVGLFGNARVWMAVAAATTLGLLLALPFAVKYLRQAPPVEAVAGHFAISAPEQVTELLLPLLAPDGRNLVFRARAEGRYSLWLRPLGSLTEQKVPGTEDVATAHFWSPDSRSIGFIAEGKLKRLEVAGGTPQTLCPMPAPDAGERASGGGTWNRDGVILFVSGGSLWRVPATGGEPALVLKNAQPGREAGGYRFPAFLPDGRHFLCARLNEQSATSEICLATLDGKEPVPLLTADSNAIYAPAAAGRGHLLFARAGALQSQPFDAESLKLTGEPFRVAEQVQISRGSRRGYFSVSDNGSLVYASSVANVNQQLNWVDRAGKLLEPAGTPGVIEAPRLSPNGKQVAVSRIDPQTRTRDIYVTDLARGVSSRLTFDAGDERFPVWSPDGSHIAWQTNREGSFQIYQKLASGIGPEELLFKSEAPIIHGSWSPDGRYLIYNRLDPKTKNDLWVLPLMGDRQPFLFLQTPFEERQGRLSPDGHWLAYDSNDQGRSEISVQPFPASGSKWQISMNGGNHPRWHGDGKELYFISPDNKLMAVEIKPGSSFEASRPKMLFDLTPLRLNTNTGSGYDVSADGQRFLFVTQGQETANLQYTVVVNWAAEAKPK